MCVQGSELKIFLSHHPLIVVLICIFVVTRDTEYHFMCLYAIPNIFLKSCLEFFAHVSVCFISCKNSLYNATS